MGCFVVEIFLQTSASRGLFEIAELLVIRHYNVVVDIALNADFNLTVAHSQQKLLQTSIAKTNQRQ